MYDAVPDPYCYPGTAVLVNRLGLRDPDALAAFEADAVMQRSDEPLPAGRLTPTHYRAVHHHLFQDVYPWAGRYRTVRLGKGQSMFCFPEHIAAQMARLFETLKDGIKSEGRDKDTFARFGAAFLGDLNAIHPFREGNGRTQMAFFALVGHRSGHPLDLSRLEPNRFLAAMIAAFHGQLRELELQIRGMTVR